MSEPALKFFPPPDDNIARLGLIGAFRRVVPAIIPEFFQKGSCTRTVGKGHFVFVIAAGLQITPTDKRGTPGISLFQSGRIEVLFYPWSAIISAYFGSAGIHFVNSDF